MKKREPNATYCRETNRNGRVVTIFFTLHMKHTLSPFIQAAVQEPVTSACQHFSGQSMPLLIAISSSWDCLSRGGGALQYVESSGNTDRLQTGGTINTLRRGEEHC